MNEELKEKIIKITRNYVIELFSSLNVSHDTEKIKNEIKECFFILDELGEDIKGLKYDYDDLFEEKL